MKLLLATILIACLLPRCLATFRLENAGEYCENDRQCGMYLVCSNYTCSSCREDSGQCSFPLECKYSSPDDTFLCLQKSLFPLSFREFVTFLVLIFAAMFAAAAGLGGGGLFVPALILVGGIPPQLAIPLSKATIFGGVVSNVAKHIRSRHPTLPLPLIQYDVALVLEPLTLVGTMFGILMNVVFPSWLIEVLLILLLVLTAFRSAKKGRKTWKKESKERAMSSNDNENMEDFDPLPAVMELHDINYDVNGEGESVQESEVSEIDDSDVVVSHQQEEEEIHTTSSGNSKEFDADSDNESNSVLDSEVVVDEPSKANENGGGDEIMNEERSINDQEINEIEELEVEVEGDEESSVVLWSRSTFWSFCLSFLVDPFWFPVEIVRSRTIPLRGVSKQHHRLEEEQEEQEEGGAHPPPPPSKHYQPSKNIPVFALLILIATWLAIFITALVKGGHGAPSMFGITSCSVLWWTFTVSTILMILVLSFFVVLRKYILHVFVPPEHLPPSEVSWKAQLCGLLPGGAILAGCAAGLLGIGGGMVKGPIMLEMGLAPQSVSATATFMILFTSSSTSFQFFFLGLLKWDYAIACWCVGFVGFVAGELVISRIIRRWGRPSLIIWMLSFVILLSAIMMGITGGIKTVQDWKDGAPMGFSSFC